MSLLMLGSMHAIKFNHLRHHRYNLSTEDIEAKSAHMTWARALLFGPLFPLILHRQALKLGNADYVYWVMAELTGNAVVVGLAIGLAVFEVSSVPMIHVALMAVGQCLTAFFAVWTVHRDCGPASPLSRTQRGFLKNMVSYGIFLHTEHHLFPNIPQRNLPIIAARLETVAPELRGKNVF